MKKNTTGEIFGLIASFFAPLAIILPTVDFFAKFGYKSIVAFLIFGIVALIVAIPGIIKIIKTAPAERRIIFKDLIAPIVGLSCLLMTIFVFLTPKEGYVAQNIMDDDKKHTLGVTKSRAYNVLDKAQIRELENICNNLDTVAFYIIIRNKGCKMAHWGVDITQYDFDTTKYPNLAKAEMGTLNASTSYIVARTSYEFYNAAEKKNLEYSDSEWKRYQKEQNEENYKNRGSD